MTIPDSVTSIDYSAFRGCTSLTSITFSDTSTWCRTNDYWDWEGKSGGTETDVTDSTANATYFVTDDYYDCYWYKI